MLRYSTAGESHGKGLVALVDGFPAGLAIDTGLIDADLRRRQGGYGRGGRQRIETDSKGNFHRVGRVRGPILPRLRSSVEQSIQRLDADERVTKVVVDQIVLLADEPEEMIQLTLNYDGKMDSKMWSDLQDLGGEVVQVFSSIDGCSVKVPADRAGQLTLDPRITQIDWNAPMGFSMDVARTAAQVPVAAPPDGGGKTFPIHTNESVVTGESAESISGTLPEDLTGAGVTIALIDSGVRTHPDRILEQVRALD